MWYVIQFVITALRFVIGNKVLETRNNAAAPVPALVSCGRRRRRRKGDIANPDDNPPPVLKFEVGTAVTFVPYERSELLSNVNGRLIMHYTNGDYRTDYPVTVPMGCAGVATQIGKLAKRASNEERRWVF